MENREWCKNLKFFISFNGAKYRGFQRQPNQPTIQGKVESALSQILNQSVTITGCSRTDTGVHAKSFCLNAIIDKTKSNIPPENLIRALNSLLPPDIAALSCEEVSEDFNARFSAKGKEYVYLINNKKQKDVFLQDLALHYPYEINKELLRKTAQMFIGEHDFAAFRNLCKGNQEQSTIREIFSFDVKQKDGFVEFIIQGNGFLYNMVRILAGTLIYVNEGKRTELDIKEALETGEREKAGKTLPPQGLYLNKVFY